VGDVFWGLHSPIAAGLIRGQGIRQAFETGTHFGFGALQLAALVENVWSVEVDPELHRFCTATYGSVKSIEFLEGDSAEHLAEFAKTCVRPTLFVLDAHWFPMSPRSSYRPTDLCPVLAELNALHGLHPETLRASAVIVDDAQMFLGSLKRPFVRAALPSITEVLEAVGALFDHVSVTDDIIIGSNSKGLEAVKDYLHWRDQLGFP
jgi:hypothetical protein